MGTGWTRSLFYKGGARLDKIAVLQRWGQVGQDRCSAKVGTGWIRSLFCKGGDRLDNIGVLQRWGRLTVKAVLKCDVMNVASFALI